MIKAVFQNGVISPLDPIPPEWSDGRELLVSDVDAVSEAEGTVPSQQTLERLDAWYEELQRLGPAEYDPGEREEIAHLMEEADRESKEHVRRQMGLR